MNDIFHIIARKTSEIVGSAFAFITAVTLIILWLISGPIFHYSDTWQLIINTATTIVTFLVVFLIQNTQNRDSKSLHLKIDELIRVHKLAHNSVIDLDKLSDKQLKQLEKQFKAISKKKGREED